jgi:hypothetical protein
LTPDFQGLLIATIPAALVMTSYAGWRFGWANGLCFIVVSGGFTAIMDFISAFQKHNYQYPGQTKLWVFSFILFGWTYTCGACLFIAEGILARKGEDISTQKNLLWQVPLLTGIIAVALDLFMDPVAVRVGIWVWFIKGNVYYQIPLLNFVGWFVLMACAPLAWIIIIRVKKWNAWQRILASFIAIGPLMILSIILSVSMNAIIGLLGVK